jgi:formate dehydrogenase major subunit
VEGSEYELEVDYILAAIGQKTDVNFIDDINKFAPEGQLALSRWGDIGADKNTLQTGIPSVFAAGDGVTGPATIIEAIAQARKASLSCHQFLSGEGLAPQKRPFLSKKDHFKKQIPTDFVDSYVHQTREEMPTLDPDNRINFKEVELGYVDETVARNEAQRCLECGCQEFLHCDLQRYSGEYGVDQEKFAGDFNEYRVDFSHPFVEIDNNKCILCSRCIRICSELAGDNALGLVNRGFSTYVAPSLGNKLTDTHCQSCGLCIDTCPTGAISENFLFKPGPVKEKALEAIDNYGSEGVSMNLMSHKNNFVMRVEGRPGLVNEQGSIGRKAKFGYRYLNSSSRIKTPMLKTGGAFVPITFEAAYELIALNIKGAAPEQTAVFAGARLTNEEIYLVQKWARKGIKTPFISNFHYMGRGRGYAINSQKNVPFDQLAGASKIYVLGADLAEDHDYVGFLVNNARVKKGVKVELISTNTNPGSLHKVDNHLTIKDYYSFVKAANMYLVKKRLQNQMYIDANTTGFEEYVKPIHEWVLHDMCLKAGVSMDNLENWALAYNNEMNAVVVFSEKYITANTSRELYNLAMITGKLGKTSSGLMPLKEKNNSQGLFDMGGFGCIKTGGIEIPRGDRPKMKQQLRNKGFKNIVVFGEDPVGTAIDKTEVAGWFADVPFVVVQDYFMTETAKCAHLVLPASFPMESAGSFTNTQKVLQQFDRQMEPKIGQTNLDQLISLGKQFELNGLSDAGEVFSEIIGHLPVLEDQLMAFMHTDGNSPERMFNHGCDYLMKRFDDEFQEAFNRY